MQLHPRLGFSLSTTALRPLAFHYGRTLACDLRATVHAPPPGLCELYGLSVLRLSGSEDRESKENLPGVGQEAPNENILKRL